MRETTPRLVRLGAPLHLALTGQSVPLSSLASPARGVERADDRRVISGIVQVLRGFAMLYGHEQFAISVSTGLDSALRQSWILELRARLQVLWRFPGRNYRSARWGTAAVSGSAGWQIRLNRKESADAYSTIERQLGAGP
jgi:hypothetical protein